ncbi:MAG: RNA polymerase sigma-54 factor [Phycisphaerae bacterium]|nr:RNA polymerase sigma-54 factor [Phycisphaerae bacterium]
MHLQQRLTPQQIQSLNILQLGVQALEARIDQELDSNPALESVPVDEAAAGDPDPEAPVETPAPTDDRTSDEFERLENLVREYDWATDDTEYRGSRSAAQLQEEGDAKLEAMANAPSRGGSLQEHLLAQWALTDTADRLRAIGVRIIESLADSGRLETPLEEIEIHIEPPATREELLDALYLVQELDPPGVAARSLQESLLLQIDALPGRNDLEAHIVESHFEDLQRNRLPHIAESLGVDLEEVKAALAVLGRLTIHPGAEWSVARAPLVTPDVLVEFDEHANDYDVRLVRGRSRELRISPEFREALETSRGDRKLREFLKEKLDAARGIIDAVRFRSDRLLDVARAVVRAQRDFLDRGEQHLKILRMSDMAAEMGCDPSTISRTVDDKYMQTPRGIFPMRRFFTGGADTGDGEALGWESIKAKVQEIVAAEDKRHPLNDDEIVERLEAQGISIKRRTIAKYRQQLDIPTARQRRVF